MDTSPYPRNYELESVETNENVRKIGTLSMENWNIHHKVIIWRQGWSYHKGGEWKKQFLILDGKCQQQVSIILEVVPHYA